MVPRQLTQMKLTELGTEKRNKSLRYENKDKHPTNVTIVLLQNGGKKKKDEKNQRIEMISSLNCSRN